MRKIDEAKRKLVIQAVFEITYDEGITNLSIGKIAKRAGVSKATIYVYFENKTDMLGKIYLEVKRLTDEGLSAKIDSSLPYKKRVRNGVEHFANRFISYPLQANFMRAVQANPSEVEPEILKSSEKLAQPIMDLFNEGVEKGYWITNDQRIVISILFSPIAQLIEYYFKKGQSVPEKQLTEMLDILVNSLVE
ncbi:TetR/AcrR family transcriptional regulator [Companilactobacillus keshanensis]|uniref:TetR/AcrR family transcriptional regulator n=1 Tax=Companilactobacillus keshanensis TaxID=2486003 RepID=A0ABW4BTU7_9LACO|nr:TetR/AcrR family transcriptional regulator [Companilactobacillus keshanensis]